MRKTQVASLDNVLRLFSKRLEDYKGESLRSYRKAYSSLQVYLMSNYSLDETIDETMIGNWVVDNIIHGLSPKTVSFYLDKISSLYSGVAHKFTGGKLPLFKEVKKRLKRVNAGLNYSEKICRCSVRLREFAARENKGSTSRLVNSFLDYPRIPATHKKAVSFVWASMALSGGIRPNLVREILDKVPAQLGVLNFFESKELRQEEKESVFMAVRKNLMSEEPKWHAMRLRPGVKYDDLVVRLTHLGPEEKKTELFYPCQEIARRMGRKVVWKGKPVIRDVVFFRKPKSRIYRLFTQIYDLAWCYRAPGSQPGNYATIPSKAMDDFKRAIGFLSPDFELAPKGSMDFKPGDEVVLIDSQFMDERARILKKPSINDDGNKIFRVTLLDRNGRWDIGIDARLIKQK